MRKPDAQLPKLTKHDQDVLRSIIAQAKTPDTEIAKRIGISPQAVFKIRQKLETSGIIKGYQPVVDYKKLGIDLLVFMVVNFKPRMWEQFSDDEVTERIRHIPNVIDAYRILEADGSHIMLVGFKDLAQMDRFMTRLQTKFSHLVELKHVYPFPAERIITQSPAGLFYEILDETEIPIAGLVKK
jgi:Lrp/AsnC family leucine-responsive transcriptional regulator